MPGVGMQRQGAPGGRGNGRCVGLDAGHRGVPTPGGCRNTEGSREGLLGSEWGSGFAGSGKAVGCRGSAGPASLLGEQPLGCKGAVAFWSSLGVLMAGGGLAPSPRLCLRPGSSGDNGTQRPAAGGCSPYLSLWSLSRWGWRGGCLQEIFGAGGVSGTGLPGPPGSAQLRTLTGRSCLISPSPPGLAQADPVA